MIVIVRGPPGVGRTTVATRRGGLEERGSSFGLLHSDEFSSPTYERMYERVSREGGDWLLDGTFYRGEWRERLRGLDEACVVRVAASLESCLERNRERADPIGETGVHVIHREFEAPRADLIVDTDELPVAETVEDRR